MAPRPALTRPQRLIVVRSLRGFADGLVSILLADHLLGLGFSAVRVGVIVTATLLGSAALTLVVGLVGARVATRTLLLAACALMAATGLGFLALSSFWPLLAVAALGTLNPSAGDVSVFLPTEQAALAGHATGAARTRLYALFNVGGTLAGALGALATTLVAGRVGFAVYVVVAGTAAATYWRLPRDPPVARTTSRPLERSRPVVLRMAALFSLDSAGGGLVVQSLLVLWLHLRFDLDTATTGAVFFAAGLLAAASQLLAPRVAARIGLVRTMAYTHLPANGFLVAAAFMPTAPLAVAALLLRALLSQMDVPARQAFVMAAVPPEERAAAASVTGVPRSLAAALTPALAGWLLSHAWLGWPLVLGGLTKATYDVLLLARFGATEVDDR